MVEAGVESQLIVFLYLLSIAAIVGVVTARYTRLQYTTGLLLAGLFVSLVGSPVDVEFTSDVILLVILPALIFDEAVSVDVEAFRRNLPPILALAVVGLLCSIAVVAVASQVVFGFPLAVAILFGAIITPTDPVSILAVFEELGVPERLKILLEGESLLNDGVSIVVYSSVLAVVLQAERRGVAVADFVPPGTLLTDIGLGILVALVGGAIVGALVGSAAYELVARVDDELTAVVITVLVAYGVYLALDLLGSSGVIGTLTAGIFLASRPGRSEMSRPTHYSIEAIWRYAAFVGNTVLFVAIGILIPFDLLLQYVPEIAAAILFVFIARAVVVYPLVSLLNRRLVTPISRQYQHVLTWSGIHASVSIALALGVTEALDGPLAEQLSALVFGVAAFTLLVNAPTMEAVIDRVGVTAQHPPTKRYQTLVGRLHGVDAALETARQLHGRDELPTSVFEDVTSSYHDERAAVEAEIEELLDTHSALREHEVHFAQRRILRAEYQSIREAAKRGELDRDVSARLLRDIEARLDELGIEE